MKRTIFYITIVLALLMTRTARAQGYDALWATGSAVPGGTQQLEKRPDGLFRFTGPLNAGELKVMTTDVYQQGTTQFLRPQLVDSYLINFGLTYVVTSDAEQPGWVVPFQEDTYYFLVDTKSRRITGELFLPWNELLIAGSAFPGGSDDTEWKRDNMLPFLRDHDNPYLFTWTGELGDYGGVEPGYFKLEGQMTWGPRELHPYTHGEDILEAEQVRRGGSDDKWHVSKQGTYRITVDLLRETIHAELLTSGSRTLEEQGTNAISQSNAAQPTSTGVYYDLMGRRLDGLHSGLNVVRRADGTTVKVIRR